MKVHEALAGLVYPGAGLNDSGVNHADPATVVGQNLINVVRMLLQAQHVDGYDIVAQTLPTVIAVVVIFVFVTVVDGGTNGEHLGPHSKQMSIPAWQP